MEDFFNIYLFGVEDAKRVAEEPNEPHVHDYEELLIGLEGQLDRSTLVVSCELVSPVTS